MSLRSQAQATYGTGFNAINQIRNGSNSTNPSSRTMTGNDANAKIMNNTLTATNIGSTSSSHSRPAPLNAEQSRLIAQTHYFELKRWLIREDALANASSRSNAREKLTRLTRQQFQELSTDVYDELCRRLDDAGESTDKRREQQPFLPVRNDFHPKRNQARQKLATLPLQRFRDLASDVYFELERRYPEFTEGTDGINETIEEQSNPASTRSGAASAFSHQQMGAGTASSGRGLTTAVPSNDIVVPNKSTLVMEDSSFAPTLSQPNLANSNTAAAPIAIKADAYGGIVNSNSSSSVLSQAGFGSNSGGLPSLPTTTSSSLQYRTGPGGSATIQQPYTRDGSDYEKESLRSGASTIVNNRMVNNSEPKNINVINTNTNTNRSSETSSVGTRFISGYAGSGTGHDSLSYDQDLKEKVTSDYEYKITILQNRVNDLEKEQKDVMQGRANDQARSRELESQVSTHRNRADEQASLVQSLKGDLDLLQTTHSRNISNADLSARLRVDIDRLTKERQEADDLANELRNEVSSLADELRRTNERYEEVLSQLEKDKKARDQTEEEMKSWRRKYEQSKTELRNIKATSQLFVGSFKVGGTDHMPASHDGLITDVHITAFQTSIDDLLETARSKEPSSVLPAMRNVVSAVEKIDADVQAIDENRVSALPAQDQELLPALKANTNATLSNLMTASRNHAVSFGVSPVSLVDAAASHLSANVVDLVRILKIRKGTVPWTGTIKGGVPMNGSGVSPLPIKTPSGGGIASGAAGIISGGMSSMKSALGITSTSSSPPVPVSSSNNSSNVNALQQQSREGNTALSAPSRPRIYEKSSSSDTHSRSHNGSSKPQVDYEREQDFDLQQSQAIREQEQSHPRYREESPDPTLQNIQSMTIQDTYSSPSTPYGRGGDDNIRARYKSPGTVAQGPASGGYDGYGGAREQNMSSPAYNTSEYGRPATILTYGSPDGRGNENVRTLHEDNQEELKNYVENQTEAIVHSIQSLLSSIRNGAQGEQLNENLTQIITIVSSIVAISKDALPPSSAEEGQEILKDLADNCDRLSEMQSQAGGTGTSAFGKQTKQAMAGASFGVAKSLKQLNSLLS